MHMRMRSNQKQGKGSIHHPLQPLLLQDYRVHHSDQIFQKANLLQM